MSKETLSLIAYIVLCVIVFEWNVNQVDLQAEKFISEKSRLETAIVEKKNEQVRLNEMIMSESDPQWIELTLMRVLGVIPEGTKKIYFHD